MAIMEVVEMTTSNAANDENFIKLTTILFQWMIFLQSLLCYCCIPCKTPMSHMTHWFEVVLILQIIKAHVLHGNKPYTTIEASYYWIAGPMGRIINKPYTILSPVCRKKRIVGLVVWSLSCRTRGSQDQCNVRQIFQTNGTISETEDQWASCRTSGSPDHCVDRAETVRV